MRKFILMALWMAAPARALPFTPNDFPSSYLWGGTANHRFSTWAAETADRALAQLEKGESFDLVLREIARARAAFQKTFDGPSDKYSPELAGVPRTTDEGTYRSQLGFKAMNELDAPTERFIDEVLARVPELSFPYKTLRDVAAARREALDYTGEHLDFPIVNVCHTLLSSSVTIVATQLKLEDRDLNGLIILHPRYRLSQSLMRDVHLRVDELVSAPDARNFAAAMQAYFHAVPYYRGSAAIGRVAFTVLHRFVFGSTRRFPVDIDVRAMTMSPPEFLRAR